MLTLATNSSTALLQLGVPACYHALRVVSASAAASQLPSLQTAPSEPKEQHQQLPNIPTAPMLDFNDPKEAFKSKSTGDIIRTLLVFKACQSKLIVHNADSLLAMSKKILGSTIVNGLIRKTFYQQFVPGPDAAGIQPKINFLKQHGVHSILDYAAEDDVQGKDNGQPPISRQPPTDTVIARTYPYQGEDKCDRRMATFIKCIEAAHSTDEGQGFAAIKVTALGLPKLLERASTALRSIKQLFSELDEDGNGFIEPEEFRRVYARLFNDASKERMARVFDYLDTDHDNKVDYLGFCKLVTVRDGAAIAARCKTDGPFKRAVLDEEEIKLLDNTINRVDVLAKMAQQSGVRLMIDAEHSYFQPAIDSIATELQSRYNKKQPIVYNTYQCYLKDANDRLALDVEKAKRDGYYFGAKLVRGAYYLLERQRAQQLGYTIPVFDTINQTHEAYNSAVALLLQQVKERGAEVMVATHNQASIEKAVGEMAALGLSPGSGVYFGQLLGMADQLTFILGAHGYGAFKYVPFGQVEEVMPYLIRRAQENSDLLGGVGKESSMLKTELNVD